MTLMEALLSSRKYYKTDKNYIFTIDKPSTTKAAVVGGALGAIKGLVGSQIGAWGGAKVGASLGHKASTALPNSAKAKILSGASKAAMAVGKASTGKIGRAVFTGAAIPLGAAIGHAMAKRKLKHADPYVSGILAKVKGQEIKRKQYRSLLKGQQAIGVSAHRLFPRGAS